MEENKSATCNFGVHLTLDGYGGDPKKLNDGQLVLRCLNELPEKLGMSKLIEPIVKECADNQLKDPGGYSGIVMIAESHISIHTFPARKFVSIDVYTCKNDMSNDFIVNYFKENFGLEDTEVNFIKRGTKYPVCNLV
ncbi:MAG: adenosylmethionine decarboxylase [Candidatus Moranbacteria bacterium CG10_big_fil_rev_8_21_14_0_10_35_21]|nr:MAG: adenosylmethionine decarboxylase [Candidatus Moranbacteria bacterium CG10_big_fil_rev_8_21_14_0_10_35_21]PJA88915.1 MAG: adenosylmethionine decarboxylase [Candidatus Moranbacteria bacterium CG_4_9_14_3_um_filter_36_9]